MSNFFSGDSGRSTSTQTVDPSQQRLNDLYFGEALGLKGTTGGVASFGGPQPGLYGLGPAESSMRNQIINLTSGVGGGGAGDPYAQVLQKLFSQANRSSDFAGETMDWSRQSPTGQTDVEALNSIRALLGRSLEGPNELEGGALRSWGSRTDPNEMLRAAERYMTTIGGPEAKAASVAGGMGGVRGGAFQEGIARESARLALPILQLINQNVGEFAGAQERVSGALEGRRRGLSGDLFQMGSNLEGRGIARRGLANQAAGTSSGMMQNLGQLMPLIDQHRLAMLTAGQQAAALPRLTALQDFLRQQDVTLSTLLRTPVKTGGTTTTNANEDLTLKSLLGPAALFAALSLK